MGFLSAFRHFLLAHNGIIRYFRGVSIHIIKGFWDVSRDFKGNLGGGGYQEPLKGVIRGSRGVSRHFTEFREEGVVSFRKVSGAFYRRYKGFQGNFKLT